MHSKALEEFRASLRSVELPKEYLGLTGEYAVATELFRRGIYAQITLGKHKRADLLAETETGMVRIQVKAKQGSEWPGCRGIHGQDIALVLVDFEGRRENESPDFYILDSEDWSSLVKREYASQISTGELVVDDENIPIWVKNKEGRPLRRPYKGIGVLVSQVSAYKEGWDKIKTMLGNG